MRWFWLVCILFIGFLQTKAQDILQTIDSLDSVAKKQEGVEKIVTMLELSEYLNEISFDECISMVEKAEREARKINHNLLISQTNLELGEYYINHYDLDLAEPYLRIAIENSGDKLYLKYDAYKYLAYLNFLTGSIDTASLYYEKSFEVAQALGEKEIYADAVNNLALISRNIGDQEEAQKGFMEAVKLYYEVDDSLSAARSLNNIALLYFSSQQYEEALSIFKDLIPVFEREGEYYDLSMIYSNFSMAYLEYRGDVDSAMIFLDKAKYYAGIGCDSLTMVDILLNEGDLYLKRGDCDKALGYYEEAKQLASRLFYNEGLSGSYFHLAEVYYQSGKYEEAISNIRLCVAIEEKTGSYLYTPMLKLILMMSYAHAGMYDSLESEVVRTEEGYNELLAEKMELEQDMEDMALLEESNDALEAENVRLRYVVAGLATLLVVLAVYTLVSGRSRKEK